MKKKLTVLGAIFVLIILLSIIFAKTKEIIVFTNALKKYEGVLGYNDLDSIGNGNREVFGPNVNKRYFRMYDDAVGKPIFTYNNPECSQDEKSANMFCVEHFRAIILRDAGSGETNLVDEKGSEYETGYSGANNNLFEYDKDKKTGFFALYESYTTIKDTNTNFAYAIAKIGGSSYFSVQNAIWHLGQITNKVFDTSIWSDIKKDETFDVSREDADVIHGMILVENESFVNRFANGFSFSVKEDKSGVNVNYISDVEKIISEIEARDKTDKDKVLLEAIQKNNPNFATLLENKIDEVISYNANSGKIYFDRSKFNNFMAETIYNAAPIVVEENQEAYHKKLFKEKLNGRSLQEYLNGLNTNPAANVKSINMENGKAVIGKFKVNYDDPSVVIINNMNFMIGTRYVDKFVVRVHGDKDYIVIPGQELDKEMNLHNKEFSILIDSGYYDEVVGGNFKLNMHFKIKGDSIATWTRYVGYVCYEDPISGIQIVLANGKKVPVGDIDYTYVNNNNGLEKWPYYSNLKINKLRLNAIKSYSLEEKGVTGGNTNEHIYTLTNNHIIKTTDVPNQADPWSYKKQNSSIQMPNSDASPYNYYYFSNGAKVDKKLVVLEIKPVLEEEDNWDDGKYDVIGECYYIMRRNYIGDAYYYDLYDKGGNKIITSLGGVATKGLNANYYVYYDEEEEKEENRWKSSFNKPQTDGFVEVDINGMKGWIFEDFYKKEDWLIGYNKPTGVNAYHIPHTQNLMTADEFEVTTSSDEAELEVIYNPEINVPRSIVLTKLNGTSDEKMAGVRFFITVTGKGKLYVYDSKCSSQSKLRMIDENELNNILSGTIDERYILTTSTDGKVYIDNIYESDLQGEIVIKSYEIKSKAGFNPDSDPIITTVADNNDGTFKVNTLLPRGDINRDGQIDVNDANLIMKYNTFMSWVSTANEKKDPKWETNWNKDADFSFLTNDETVSDTFKDEFNILPEFGLGYLRDILKYGDMNNDGIVDSSDAAYLLQNYVNRIINSTSYETYSIPINIPNYPTYTFVLNKISSETGAGVDAAKFKVDIKYKLNGEDVIETYDGEDIITNTDGKIEISLSEEKCKGEIGIYLREKEVPGYKCIKGLVRYVFRVEHIERENDASGYIKYFEPIDVSLFLRNSKDGAISELSELDNSDNWENVNSGISEWKATKLAYNKEDDDGQYVQIPFLEENGYKARVPVKNINNKYEFQEITIAPGSDNQIIKLSMENVPTEDVTPDYDLKIRKVYLNGNNEYVPLSGATISCMVDRIENGEIVNPVVSGTVKLNGDYVSLLPGLLFELNPSDFAIAKAKLTSGWYRLTVQENEAPSGCEKLMGNFTYDYFVDKDGKITSKSGNSNALFETNGSETNVNCLALDFVNEKNDTDLITTMNLAGTVFVEGFNGKGNSKNNTLDDGEGFGGANVKVTLWEAGYYDANGTLQLYTNPVMPKYEFMPTYENATTYNGNTFNESHSTTEYAKLFQAFEENLGDDLKNWKELGQVAVKDVNGKAVTLYQQNANAIPDELKRTNPTVTDSSGTYRFEGLNPTKKYFVTFEYNGMLYQTVTFNEGGATYNTDQWAVTSKVEDTKVNGVTAITRDSMNHNFVEIGSYPKGYKVNDALFKADTYLTKDGNEYYNITFTNKELIDTKFGEAGNIYEIIDDRIDSSYYKKLSYKDTLKGLSYNFGDDELNKKFKCMVQFIYDCTVTADTRANGNTINTGVDSGYNVNGNIYYPVYEQFSLVGSSKDYSISNGEFLKNDMGYPVIYDGQEHINCGLKLRASFDVEIAKAVACSTVTLKGYKFNEEPESLFGQTSMFSQRIYMCDVAYEDSKPEYNIQHYMTYGITLTNNSSINATITELVDYMDDRYELVGASYNLNTLVGDGFDSNGLFQYKQNEKSGLSYSESSRYGSATHKSINYQTARYITFGEGLKLNGGSNDHPGESKTIYLIYKLKDARNELIKCKLVNDGTHADDDNYRLKANNYVEINGYRNEACKVAEKSTPGNLVNSRITDRTDEKSTTNFSDYIDGKGNIHKERLRIRKGSIIQKEPDEAQAPEAVLTLAKERIMKGAVFEDKYSKITLDGQVVTYEGLDGKQNSGGITGEPGIEGVNVVLMQYNKNGGWSAATLYDRKTNSWVTDTMQTDENGKYQLANYLPGKYYVKFVYGNSKDTVLTDSNGGKNLTSYNGQDYQSTIDTSGLNYSDTHWYLYNGEGKSVATDTFYTRNNAEIYSKTIRNHSAEVLNSYKVKAENVNNDLINELISNTSMIAVTETLEVTNDDINRVLVNNLNDEEIRRYNTEVNYVWSRYNSWMNGIVTDPENPEAAAAEREAAGKWRDEALSDIRPPLIVSKNDILAHYSLSFLLDKCQVYGIDFYENKVDNINLGLTERPKSKLIVTKDVESVKLTVQNKEEVSVNSNKPYDAKGVIWQKPDENSGITGYGNGLIWLQKEDDAISGGLLEVTYKISVANKGEFGYNTEYNRGYADYYTEMLHNSDDIITTSADILIDYVDSNYAYDPDVVAYGGAKNGDYWDLVTAEEIQNRETTTLVNNLGINLSKYKQISLDNYDTILKTNTNKLAKGAPIYLTLTKKLSKDFDAVEFEYNNCVEIVQTSNSIGRKDCCSIPGNFSPADKTSMPGNLIELVTTKRDGYDDVYGDGKHIEYDTDFAETIVISAPTGEENPKQYYILAIAIVALLGIGTFGIKKFVVDNTNEEK